MLNGPRSDTSKWEEGSGYVEERGKFPENTFPVWFGWHLPEFLFTILVQVSSQILIGGTLKTAYTYNLAFHYFDVYEPFAKL